MIRSVRAIACGLALLLPLGALADVPWYVGGACEGTGTGFFAPRRASAIEPGAIVSWCPDGSASPPITADASGACSWDDGGSAVTLSITDVRSGEVFWESPAQTSCAASAGAAACSSFTLEEGRTYTLSAGNAGQVTCSGKRSRN